VKKQILFVHTHCSADNFSIGNSFDSWILWHTFRPCYFYRCHLEANNFTKRGRILLFPPLRSIFRKISDRFDDSEKCFVSKWEECSSDGTFQRTKMKAHAAVQRLKWFHVLVIDVHINRSRGKKDKHNSKYRQIFVNASWVSIEIWSIMQCTTFLTRNFISFHHLQGYTTDRWGLAAIKF
jgi:hypothetical protein